METPLDIFINPSTSYCGYEGTTNKLIVNWVYPLFLKAKAEASEEDKPSWNQAIKFPLADGYCQYVCTKLETLEGMVAWDVVDG